MSLTIAFLAVLYTYIQSIFSTVVGDRTEWIKRSKKKIEGKKKKGRKRKKLQTCI